MKLGDWGDFLAGVTAPLAFLWLIVGYFQQGEDLRLNTEALRLQRDELKNQVQATENLLGMEREKLADTRRREKQRSELRLKYKTCAFTVEKRRFEFYNVGGTARDLVATLEGANGTARIHPDALLGTNEAGHIDTVPRLDLPLLVRVAYTDDRGSREEALIQCMENGFRHLTDLQPEGKT